MAKNRDGTAEIHDTTVHKVSARWSKDGALAHDFIASVEHLLGQNKFDLSFL
jgi:hypothetical protein